MLDKTVIHRIFSSREVIFQEGEPAGYIYNVVRGNVRLYKLLADGRRQITGFLKPGNFLGLSKREIYVYSAEAIDNVELCSMSMIDFERLLQEAPAVRDRLLEMSRDELSAAQEQMILLGRKAAREKLVSFLYMYAQDAEESAKSNPQVIYLPMTREDIADYLGLTIETVSRTFTLLRKDGLIDLPSASHVSIPDLSALEAIANPR